VRLTSAGRKCRSVDLICTIHLQHYLISGSADYDLTWRNARPVLPGNAFSPLGMRWKELQ
jgi:hypothetical protein